MIFSSKLQEEILQKLIYKGKKPPAQKTCSSKIKYATTLLFSISSDPTPELAKFSVKILESINIYLSDTKFPTLDKIILKILNKQFCEELISFIRTLDDPEIVAGVCYVKFKHLSVVDDRIFEIYEFLSTEIKNKIDSLFKEIISQRINKYTQKNTDQLVFQGQNLVLERDTLRSQTLVYSPFIQKNLTQLHKISKIKDIKRLCFCFSNKTQCEATNKEVNFVMKHFMTNMHWGDFSGYQDLMKSGNYKVIVTAIQFIKSSKLKIAKELMLNQLKREHCKSKTLLYNLLALIHVYSLEYQEALYYLDLQIENSSCFELDFSLNCKFLLERLAEIHGITPVISLYMPEGNQNDQNFIKNNFENKYLIKQIYGHSLERINIFNDTFCSLEVINTFIKSLSCQIPNYSIFFIFRHSENVCIYNFELQMQIFIPWSNVCIQFESIMTENQKILSLDANTPEDKRFWWSSRIKLDSQLECLIKYVRNSISIPTKSNVLLILEDEIAYFPFELVFDKPAMRILSRDCSSLISSISTESAFYLLDPANNLPYTKECISNYLNQKNFSDNLFKGVIGRSLTENELKNLENNDIFLYFGHGSGKKYFKLSARKPKLLFLFGCSSCRLLSVRNFKANGYCLRHFNKRRIVLGNLWDVTDKDLDKVTISILDDFLAGKSLVESVHQNRNECKLKYLNSAALVLYGCFSEILCKL